LPKELSLSTLAVFFLGGGIDEMIERLLKRWPLRLFLKKISWLTVAMTGILLVILTGLSIYGNSVGDLVITVDELTVRALALSETGEFGSDATTLLAAEGIKDVRDSTYSFIPEDIREGNGIKSDYENNFWFGYSFYVKNMSDVSVGYSGTFKFEQRTKGIDSAVRIMVLVDDEPPVIFARPKADGTPEILVANGNSIKKGYKTIPFTEDEVEVYRNDAAMVGLIQKFTIIIWLEGWDSDCVDDIVGGQLEGSMTFRIDVGNQ
jgi:hypothetical protein